MSRKGSIEPGLAEPGLAVGVGFEVALEPGAGATVGMAGAGVHCEPVAGGLVVG